VSGCAEIIGLVKRFELHRESYQSAQYNETQLRRKFVDPFFKALGWDVDNEYGYAEAYKDVVHEDAIKIGGTTNEMLSRANSAPGPKRGAKLGNRAGSTGDASSASDNCFVNVSSTVFCQSPTKPTRQSGKGLSYG